MVEKEADSVKMEMTDRLVYQLVRVDENGTVVPATKDEVIQMESFLEGDVDTQVPNVESNLIDLKDCDVDICEPQEGFSTKDKSLASTGLFTESQDLGGLEAERKRLLAQLEFLDTILQRLKDEEQQRVCSEGVDNVGVYSKLMEGHKNPWKLELLSDKPLELELPSDKPLESLDIYDETSKIIPVPVDQTNQDKSYLRELESPLSTSKQSWISIANGDSVRDKVKQRSVNDRVISPKSMENVNMKGPVCLDNLSIRELHEAFRATFGRETSVKDKQWLKRRILMGRTESSERKTNNVTQESKLFSDEETHELTARIGSSPADQPLDFAETGLELQSGSPETVSSQTKFADQKKDIRVIHQSTPIPVIDKIGASEILARKDELLLNRDREGKRQRKPTKRYIEELAMLDTKDITGKSSGRGSNQDRFAVESRDNGDLSEPGDQAGPVNFGVSIRKLRTGYRRRHDRPKKNARMPVKATLLVSRGASELTALPLSNSSNHLTALPNSSSSESSIEAIPAVKDGTKRKHQHPWTLREVMKLVEGVSRCGVGKWAEIKKFAFSSSAHRTSMDLKDKWRNLLRASNTHFQLIRRGEHRWKHGSPPIPSPVLVRIRELAAEKSQTGQGIIDNGISKSGRIIPRRQLLP